MPTAVIDGIATNYEVVGDGPALLMFAPGGFNARLDNWSGFSVYGRTKPLEHLSRHYRCIVFDRRESGRSGGRIERVTWQHYVAQGKALLDHLGIGQAHLMGGCQGCSPVTAFAAAHPDVVRSMVLYWPAGGPKYRIASHARFSRHLAYVQSEGLEQVAALARSTDKHFGQDPRLGPWGSAMRLDDSLAETFVRQDPDRYRVMVTGMARGLLDRDTVPGAEPEDLLNLDIPTLIVPGHDDSHATSAARYLEECLPASEYWDAPVADQTEQTVSSRLLKFLDAASAQRWPTQLR